MAATIVIRDETATGRTTGEFRMEVRSGGMTLRDLIRGRIQREVAIYNESNEPEFRGLVQPTWAELALNGVREKVKRRIDADQQIAEAFRAFESNGFFVFVNDRQVESLDEQISVMDQDQISFIRLVPLVGG